jgi:hypothetical protein
MKKNRHLKKNSITEIPSETFIKLAQLRLLLVLNSLIYYLKKIANLIQKLIK